MFRSFSQQWFISNGFAGLSKMSGYMKQMGSRFMHTETQQTGGHSDQIKQIAGKVTMKERVVTHLSNPTTLLMASFAYGFALTDPVNIVKNPVSTVFFGSVFGGIGATVASLIKDRAFLPMPAYPFISGILYVASFYRVSYAFVDKMRDDREFRHTERKIREVLLEEETKREKHIREIYKQEEDRKNKLIQERLKIEQAKGTVVTDISLRPQNPSNMQNSIILSQNGDEKK
jgi:hypothetical protein